MEKSKKEDIPWNELPEVLKPEQVQKKIQISRATFFRLVSSGKLPGAKKVGDSWRVDRNQLRAYFQGEEMEAKSDCDLAVEDEGAPLTQEEIEALDNYVQLEDEEEDSDSEQSVSDGK